MKVGMVNARGLSALSKCYALRSTMTRRGVDVLLLTETRLPLQTPFQVPSARTGGRKFLLHNAIAEDDRAAGVGISAKCS